MWQGVLPADPYLLRVVEAGNEDLVARSRLRTRQRLSVVCGENPLPQPAWHQRTLRLVRLSLSRDGRAIELVDLVDEHGGVEVGRRHRALDQLLLLEDVLELRPLRESADAEAWIGAVVHPLQHEARVEHVQRVLERLGLVARLRLRLR